MGVTAVAIGAAVALLPKMLLGALHLPLLGPF